MTSDQIRQTFLDYFESKGHKVVPSAPIVVKNDPTLMFTNAGMNQFKDYFLGNKIPDSKRITDTQKCLRVSGKHNDLEEVGVDTYHHTMFEMLGNWSFGDYFKKETIAYAWELLTDVYKLPVDRLYITIFEGDKDDKLDEDTEALEFWKGHVAEDRILKCDKKDNFWEMGDVGPAGPCSEIHIDLRSDSERQKVEGKSLVNQDHEQVIEIWNLVFIQFNRLANGDLEELPQKHVDTGMGFERLVRALDGKSSNYSTDIFMDTIRETETLSGKIFGENNSTDTAFRVIADHVRALSFTIADGQLPSNTGAGYVIRRILRRAVRYGYSQLGFNEAFIYKLVPSLANKFKAVFPELQSQVDFVQRVIEEEENSFLRTLSRGVDKLELAFQKSTNNTIDGVLAFELFDTYGFPVDLTQLMASEQGFEVDMKLFSQKLEEQKTRSRSDADKETGDWINLQKDEKEEFIGYDYTEAEVKITRYRKMKSKKKEFYQVVLNLTPFYAESGGQVGDTGVLISDSGTIKVLNTLKENELILHIVDELPNNLTVPFNAKVDRGKRQLTTYNHSATHLLHAALKEVLGQHVAQKGSLVNHEHLRFDFSHFSKLTEDELAQIETLVNAKIRMGIALDEKRNIPYKKAIEGGVTALFGEKYGDTVRVITFGEDFSKELCGGTHVKNTASIGNFKITSEASIASGVRRIEAITNAKADILIEGRLKEWQVSRDLLGNPKDLGVAVQQLLDDQQILRKQIEKLAKDQVGDLKLTLSKKIQSNNDINYLIEKVDLPNKSAAKDLAFQIRKENENLVLVLATDVEGKPGVTVIISDNLVGEPNLHAGNLVRELAVEIGGGGGGQPFFAQAGGSNISGLDNALQKARKLLGLD
jgi:alanyl-tRNA synthetase